MWGPVWPHSSHAHEVGPITPVLLLRTRRMMGLQSSLSHLVFPVGKVLRAGMSQRRCRTLTQVAPANPWSTSFLKEGPPHFSSAPSYLTLPWLPLPKPVRWKRVAGIFFIITNTAQISSNRLYFSLIGQWFSVIELFLYFFFSMNYFRTIKWLRDLPKCLGTHHPKRT